MTRKQEVQEEPQPQAEESPVVCEFKPVDTLTEDYSGQGGSFVLDSSTGLRTLVHQTKPATEA